MTKASYTKTARSNIPADVRWDTPAHLQGQMVEVSYAEPRAYASEACHGAAYQRVHDRGDNSIDYYVRTDLVREPEPTWGPGPIPGIRGGFAG